ncbi:MAG TPA: DUF3108 domain-containing protein [Aquaticitalea sp.]|nr:DUF3108 domain-containing protein [Aquaticitalea sp.]
MKKTLLITVLLAVQFSFPQKEQAFQAGEWFKFEISYSNWLKAGNATLDVRESTYKGKPVYHVVGKGWTTGAIKWFFKVKDNYESYFDKHTGLPYKSIRQIDEGGHTKDIVTEFDQLNNKAYVNNRKHKKESIHTTEQNVQDMVSAFYYLRNNYDTETIKEGETVGLNMFFDEENYHFKLKFLGRETISTKFGKVKTLKFRPYVMAGRVFKEEESLTLWVSADKNKIPLKVKANLRVGSLQANLEAFKGLKHSFVIQVD